MPRDVVDLPLIGRAASVRPDSVNNDDRTFEVVWTTGATRRCFSWSEGEFDEELVVSPNAIRMGRLQSGAPFLNSHDGRSLSSILGVVSDARIEGGKGYATIRFSDRDDVEPIWRDIQSGIIRNVSVGYKVHRYEIEKREGKRPLYRATDWEPAEISAVAIGADIGAQIRADVEANPCAIVRSDPAADTAVQPNLEESMENETQGRAGQDDAARFDAEAMIRSERDRVAAIDALCARHDIPADRRASFISSGAAINVVRGEVLDMLAERDAAGARAPVPAEARNSRLDETETRRRGMEEALLSGLTGSDVPEIGLEYRRMSLVDMAAARLGERRVPGSFGEREELLRRAFHSTSDFPQLFGNALNRSLASRYAQAQPTYRQIARQRTYQDFRDHTTIRVGDFPELQEVSAEAGEIRGGTFSEAAEATRVKSYAVRVNLSLQMLVNDRLNGIQAVLNDQGAAVSRLEDKLFYTMLLSGANSDGPTLSETSRQVFNTTDGTKAASAAAINVTSLALGRAAMRKQKSRDGALLDVTPAILLVGPDKETEAQQVVAPIQAQQAGNVNPFAATMRVVATARITGNAWYLFASPAEWASFEWGLLDGYDAPQFRIEDVFGVLGTSMTLVHHFGCGAVDYRGVYRNAGA